MGMTQSKCLAYKILRQMGSHGIPLCTYKSPQSLSQGTEHLGRRLHHCILPTEYNKLTRNKTVSIYCQIVQTQLIVFKR